MRQVSLREFRTSGEQAPVPRGEIVLLSGQKGPVYYLVPVEGDLAIGDKELRRAMAKASLQESWRHAEEQSLNRVLGEEIDDEIRRVRQQTKQTKDG